MYYKHITSSVRIRRQQLYSEEIRAIEIIDGTSISVLTRAINSLLHNSREHTHERVIA